MVTDSRRIEGQDLTLSRLNVAIDALNIATDCSSVAPAKAAFGAVGVLLTMIKDTMTSQRDYVDIGLACADICSVLDQGMDGKPLNDLSRSVYDAIHQLTIAASDIQRRVVKQRGRGRLSRLFRVKNDKDQIAAWKLELDRILQVLNTELGLNTHVMEPKNANAASKNKEVVGQVHPAQVNILGESPPPRPRACFGREQLIEQIVSLAENLNPIALIGAGGIGKTSIALTVLHHNRVKGRFGDDRRFIRCDQFPASPANFLCRLSRVIGAAVENPKDLTPLRSYLSSKEMFIILDNAESILDPQGAHGQEFYYLVEELSQFSNICLAITSRITTVPPDCWHLDIHPLSMDAARSTFRRIHGNTGQQDLIDKILRQLDFHPLSVTLLATLARQQHWGGDRLAREWEKRRTGVFQTNRNESLATTIELSLASPTFNTLGPHARDLLGVIAFFPQGLDTKNLDWLFPTIPNATIIIDTFCELSLAYQYQSNGFISMLLPLRDYLSPRDPSSSPLLCMAKKYYFDRMSVKLDPGGPGFEDSRWIVSEDVNVEHLLSVFISLDANSNDVWSACVNFLEHLYWHKPRQTLLGPKIEQLPEDHPFKPKCLFYLARLFESVGNHSEQKRLFSHTLRLERECRDDQRVALTLRNLSDANRTLGLYEEGIHQIKESLEIYERIGEMTNQGESLILLAQLLCEDKQLDAAEEAAFRAVELLPEKGEEGRVCFSHRVLGEIHRSKGEREEAIHHFERALKIASPFNWGKELFSIHFALSRLFLDEVRFQDAHHHIEAAKSHVVDDNFHLGCAILLQAGIWYQESRLEDATSGALQALEIFENLGALGYVAGCRALLQNIEQAKKS